MERGILHDIRVLDFTRVLAGPFAARILGDFGAEVIKVQSRESAGGGEDNNGAYFRNWNRNKRSISLNMDHPEACEMARRLVAKCDVIIENFSPRVMSNWGMDYEKLREVREDIIMVSMSGMGQTGPWRDYTAFGPTVQSLSGFTFLTSYDPETPMGLGFSYADAIAGLYGALAVLAALQYRDDTGRGQFIDLSEYEAACTLLGPALLDTAFNQAEILPKGNQSCYIPAAPHGCYRCLGDDRWCAIAVFTEDEWRTLRNLMGDPSWAGDNRFSTMTNRKKHEAELDGHMEKWTMGQKAEEIVDRLQAANIASGVVQNAEDLARDPHLSARKFFKELRHPALGTVRTDICPIRLKGGGEGHWRASPALGEDNRYVYHELLGLSEEKISDYMRKGMIA